MRVFLSTFLFTLILILNSTAVSAFERFLEEWMWDEHEATLHLEPLDGVSIGGVIASSLATTAMNRRFSSCDPAPNFTFTTALQGSCDAGGGGSTRTSKIAWL